MEPKDRIVRMKINAKKIHLPCWLAHEIRERLDSELVQGAQSYEIADID